jgi:hypothetical protein
MIGPILLVGVMVTIGALTEGVAGAVGAGLAALGMVAAVAAGAALWAVRMGRMMEPADAWRLAPRPPLFARLCEAVYRRLLPRPGS